MSDRRCKLGLRARIEIVEAVERGESQRSVARRYAVSAATVHTLWHRWRVASAAERERGECLLPRRPVPKSCPWALSAEEEQRILTAREKTNWGPMRLAALTGRHRSTNWKVLRRHGCSRRRQVERLVLAERSARALEEPVTGDEGVVCTFGDLLTDPQAEAAFERVPHRLEVERTVRLLEGLSER
jgi:transposase